MSFDAGAIEARLTLDRSEFQLGLLAAAAEKQAFDNKLSQSSDRAAASLGKVAAAEKVTGAAASVAGAKGAAAGAATAAGAGKASNALTGQTAAQTAAGAAAVASGAKATAAGNATKTAAAAAAVSLTAQTQEQNAAGNAATAAAAKQVSANSAVAASTTKTAQAVAKAATGAGGGGGGTPWWQAHIPLWGGVLPGMLGGIAAWHLIADAVVEFMAVLIPATIAVIAFGIAGASAADAIFTHLKAVSVVTSATGQSFRPLTGSFQDLQNAVKPEVFQLYGDVLSVLNARTGTFASVSKAAGSVLDQLGAQFAVFLKSRQAGSFLANGPADLARLSEVVGNLGGTLGELFKQMPGYAEILLNLWVGFSRLLEVTTGLAGPLLHLGLIFHGAIVYLGLAATLVASLVRGSLALLARGALAAAVGVSGLGRAGATAGEGLFNVARGAEAASNISWGWVTLGVAALALFVWWASQSKDATQLWVGSLQSMVDKSSIWTGFNNLLGTIQKTREALLASQKDLVNMPLPNGPTTGKFANPYAQQQAWEIQQQQQRVSELANAYIQFNDQASLAVYRLGGLSAAYGGFQNAAVLAQMAGIKFNAVIHDSPAQWAVAKQEIYALVLGYKDMSQQGSLLASDINAVTFASELQSSKVSQLNQGWQTFLSTVTGGEGALVTFLQGTAQLGTQASATGSSLDGLNANSLTLRATWQSSISNASSYLQQLTQQAAVANLGAKGTNLLQQAGKDLLAQMLPLARGSSTATAELYALAQEAGYHGKDSFEALTKWIGNEGAAKAAQDLNRITGTLTRHISDLTTDVSNLSTELGQNLNQVMENAVVHTSGATKAMKNYTTDLLENATSIRRTQNDRLSFIEDQIKSGVSLKEARARAEALTTQIWSGYVALNSTHESRSQLITDLYGMGQRAGWSQGQIATMIGEILKIPKSEVLSVYLSGQGHYSIKQELPSTPGVPGVVGPHPPTTYATGGRVPGFGGGDTKPALLEGGEAVIDKYRTRMLAPLFAAVGVPGFSSGGLITSSLPSLGQFYDNMHTTFINEMAQSAATDMQNSISQAQRMLSGAGGAGVARWDSVMLAALQMLGQPSSDLPIVARQMNTESGGYPYAVNRSDSNWHAGHPSTGLMQVIAGTFDAYSGPFRGIGPFMYGVSVNPLANVYAGLNYAVHRYGPGWTSVLGQGHGYDSGGPLPTGTRLVSNHTGRTEEVLTPSEREAFVALAKLAASGQLGRDSNPLIGTYAPVYNETGETANSLGDLLHMLQVARQQNYTGVLI